MIENVRHYEMTKQTLHRFRGAIAVFDLRGRAFDIGHTFAEAELDALKTERDVLQFMVEVYERNHPQNPNVVNSRCPNPT
jgi:hypothetical protein